MHRFTNQLACAAGVVALLTACQADDPTAPAGAKPASPAPGMPAAQAPVDKTSFQQAVMETMARRAAQGLPVPSAVTFDYQSGAPAAPALAPGVQTTVAATTVIHFDGPAQAGLVKWPDLVVKDNRGPGVGGIVREGDYTEVIRQKTAEQVPGVWQVYTYGYEPRTYTFRETLTITDARALRSSALNAVTAADEFLMGLTVPGPGLDYTIDFDYEVCVLDVCATAVDFLAGFRLDWALGLRLPMALSLASSAPLLEGSTYFPTSVTGGLDWSGQQYTQAGVAPENGNEYVVRFEFVLGVFLEVFGADVIDLGPNIDINRTTSFATPFGPGQTFALPSIDITLWDYDASVAYAAVGFQLTPHAGSDRFTAAWAATSEASGSGTLTYTNPAFPVSAGPLSAIDGPGVADVTLQDLRYYFTQFLLDLGLFFHLDVFEVVDETFTVPITDFDLSALTGNLYVGTHAGTPSALTASIPIDNVAPTAEIDRSGTVLVQGVPTFVGEPGGFTGTATDPGRDDLTLSWDWNDGAPAPDVSTLYPVPHEVTETRAHTFGGACLYRVGFRAVDDDLAFGEDQVPVVIVAASHTRSRMEGYWQHQLGGTGNVDFDAATLDCMLSVVGHVSAVFHEARAAATPASAYDVLHVKQNGGSSREQLDRELLVAWLNFAAGAFGYTELVGADEGGTSQAPFVTVLAAAESVRLNPGSTNAQIDQQTRIVHAVNESRVGAT